MDKRSVPAITNGRALELKAMRPCAYTRVVGGGCSDLEPQIIVVQELDSLQALLNVLRVVL